MQQPQKSHKQDSTKKSSNRSIIISLRPTGCMPWILFCVFEDFYASGTQDVEVTRSVNVQSTCTGMCLWTGYAFPGGKL